MEKKRSTVLVIPDYHAHPRYDNARASALGHYILEHPPTHIVCLGDWADMPSLAWQEKGKLAFEGRRYKVDIEASSDGMEKLISPWRKLKEKPRMILTYGNHEAHIQRAVEDNPILSGSISVEDLHYRKFGWETYPFLKPAVIEGIYFCHYFVSGLLGKPISGESPAKQLCLKLHRSSVVGHSHIYDHSERRSIDGTRMFGLAAGCFVHPKFDEPWATQSKDFWFRGVTELIDLDGKGYYDQLRVTTMRKILREYS